MGDAAFQRLSVTRIRLAGLAALVVIAAAGHVWFSEVLTIESVVSWETALRGYQESSPRVVYGAAFAGYVVLAGLSLPGAFVLTLVLGWYFGFLQSLLLVSFASTTGASIAFLLSRYLLRDQFRSRFGARLRTFNDALARDGAFYLFTLRLVPLVPFFLEERSVVPVIEDDRLVVDVEDVRGDPVEELVVVGNHNHGARKVAHERLEPTYREDVQVVRRLVQEQDVGCAR